MLKKSLSLTLCSALMLPLMMGAGVQNNHLHIKTKDVQNPFIKDGMTQPVYSLEEAVTEKVFIETKIDSDRDGKRDRVHADVIRPKETEEGLKVPVIYEMSPYRAGLEDVPVYDVNTELYAVPKKSSQGNHKGKPFAEGSAGNLPGYYDDYFVPRGYGVVLAESIGTGLSGGCPTTGDEREIEGTKAVIDWLNGRAKAYTEDGKEVNADWSTGNVGMTGVSYNGTLPNAVAGTGVKGLKTIVPIAAISSWYDYYRGNGAVIAPGGYPGEDTDNMAEAILTRENPEACRDVMKELSEGQDRKTGDYNEYWSHRDYVKNANQVKASVFVVHGLNDWNVKTKQFAQWWDALEKNHVPRKLWLHQGGHANPYSFRRDVWLPTLNKWFDYWLYNVKNDVMEEPAVDIQREDKHWDTESSWPAKDTKSVVLHLKPETLSKQPDRHKQKELQTILDDAQQKAEDLVLNPETASANRLAYVTPKLEKDVRISGTPEVNLRASIDRPVANLTALLVDYGPEKTEIVTRGWMDPQNLRSESRSLALTPGKSYAFEWSMQPDDYVVKAGHKLGLVLLSSDYNYTLRPKPGTKITVEPQNSELILPVTGGSKSLEW
ncbi:dipeptidyl-peptidase IV Serine peptidase. MEROPS family S15 [Bacillus sp. OV194]|nr:dipeptidyl-peptidase IV Serine peptidase. MEROPS family S15 [Bacillus sp. OV194]